MAEIPQTPEAALLLTSEEAAQVLETLIESESLDEIMSVWEPPQDFEDPAPKWVLAGMISVLNRAASHPNGPFGEGGWMAVVMKDIQKDASGHG